MAPEDDTFHDFSNYAWRMDRLRRIDVRPRRIDGASPAPSLLTQNNLYILQEAQPGQSQGGTLLLIFGVDYG